MNLPSLGAKDNDLYDAVKHLGSVQCDFNTLFGTVRRSFWADSLLFVRELYPRLVSFREFGLFSAHN